MPIIGDLEARSIGRKAVKVALSTIFTEVSTRALGGVGLALVVAEIAWCMY